MKNEMTKFIADNNITLTSVSASSNPTIDRNDMFHYHCVLNIGGKTLAVPFSKGGALLQLRERSDRLRLPAGTTAKDIEKAKKANVYYDFKLKTYRTYGASGSTVFLNELYQALFEPAPPTAEDVLEALAMDSAVLNNGGFEDWAYEFGYDTDSRQAKRIYDTCIEQALALKAILGADTLEQLQSIEA